MKEEEKSLKQANQRKIIIILTPFLKKQKLHINQIDFTHPLGSNHRNNADGQTWWTYNWRKELFKQIEQNVWMNKNSEILPKTISHFNVLRLMISRWKLSAAGSRKSSEQAMNTAFRKINSVATISTLSDSIWVCMLHMMRAMTEKYKRARFVVACCKGTREFQFKICQNNN